MQSQQSCRECAGRHPTCPARAGGACAALGMVYIARPATLHAILGRKVGSEMLRSGYRGLHAPGLKSRCPDLVADSTTVTTTMTHAPSRVPAMDIGSISPPGRKHPFQRSIGMRAKWPGCVQTAGLGHCGTRSEAGEVSRRRRQCAAGFLAFCTPDYCEAATRRIAPVLKKVHVRRVQVAAPESRID